MREVSENLLNYIKEEIQNVPYGKITIELVGTSDKIDVIVENRKRFEKEKPVVKAYKRVIRKDEGN